MTCTCCNGNHRLILGRGNNYLYRRETLSRGAVTQLAAVILSPTVYRSVGKQNTGMIFSCSGGHDITLCHTFNISHPAVGVIGAISIPEAGTDQPIQFIIGVMDGFIEYIVIDLGNIPVVLIRIEEVKKSDLRCIGSGLAFQAQVIRNIGELLIHAIAQGLVGHLPAGVVLYTGDIVVRSTQPGKQAHGIVVEVQRFIVRQSLRHWASEGVVGAADRVR